MATIQQQPPVPKPRRLSRATDGLRRFQLEGVRQKGVKVGDGSYATVEELEFRGLKCVGKKIHDLLLAGDQLERIERLQRFAGECELLGGLHHPCIVQFLGVYFECGSQVPVMVMEYLPTTLAGYLKRYGILHEEISYGIFRDVALGLRYLHEHLPTIVHRDLSANNVLLTTDMSAKISDLGVAKILNLSPAQMSQRISTQVPGTPCYMPPEALASEASYTPKIDSYSYGVLMIHTLCGRWPFPSNAFRSDPHNPGSFLPVEEFDRRMEHLQVIGLDHPLMELIRQCLSNIPATRPEASEILCQIEAMISKFNLSPANKLELIQRSWQKSEIEAPRNEDGETQAMRIEALEAEIEIQRRQIEIQRSEIVSKTKEVESQRCEIQSLREQLKELSVTLPPASTVEPPSSLSPTQPAALPIKLPVSTTVHPHTALKWRRCKDLPVGMNQHCSVLYLGKVCVGGGYTGSPKDQYLVFQYDHLKDSWDALPACSVMLFALAQFQGCLITLGGIAAGEVTEKVYSYNEEAREWVEFLKPMSVARYGPSVITTQSAIIACGGRGRKIHCMEVEVYTSEAGRWFSADPLPSPYIHMVAVTIRNTCYLLGGNRTDNRTAAILYVQISTLIERAVSTRKSSRSSVWMSLPDTPLYWSAAANLGGCLLAAGGHDFQCSSWIHMLLPEANSWARMPSGDLPVAFHSASAIGIPGNQLLVCGGHDDKHRRCKAVFVGSIIY